MSRNDAPKWAPIQIDEEVISSLSRSDDAPRKLIRGKLLRRSEECKKNRHRLCSSSHCKCKCHEAVK